VSAFAASPAVPFFPGSRFGLPPAPRALFASARPLGVSAVRLRRSRRSFSGWVAVPLVPRAAASRGLGAWCGSWQVRLCVPVLVRSSRSGWLPSVPVLPRRAPRFARPVLRARSLAAVRWVVAARRAAARRSAAFRARCGRLAPVALAAFGPRPRWSRSLRPLFGRAAGFVALGGVVARPRPALVPAPVLPSGPLTSARPRLPRRRFAPAVLVASCPVCGARCSSRAVGASSCWLFCPWCGCSAAVPAAAWAPASAPFAFVPPARQLELF
jgi:hypothetical protein